MNRQLLRVLLGAAFLGIALPVVTLMSWQPLFLLAAIFLAASYAAGWVIVEMATLAGWLEAE